MRWIIRLVSHIGLAVVVPTAAHTNYLTQQIDGISILMLGDERIFDFVSAAKNTVAFYKISFSICRRFPLPATFTIMQVSQSAP